MPRPVATLRALLALATLAAAGCDHAERTNVDPAREAWTASSENIRNRVTELRTRQQELVRRIDALAVPEGTEDARLAAAIGELKGQEPGLDQAVGAAEMALAQTTANSEVALSKPNKIAAKQIVDDGLAKFATAAEDAKRALDAITPQVASAESMMQRLLDAIAAEVQRLQNLAMTGGSADFSDIDFQAGSAEFDFTHPGSKATLDRLVKFAQSCEQLRFALTGHTSREGKPALNKALSLTRAEAVKRYLITAGVAAAKVTGTLGLGSARTMIDEPEPGTPAEAAMAPDELEARRRKNRRVTVDVSTACAVPTAAPPTAPPVGAADAIAPGAPRGTAPGTVERIIPPAGAPPAGTATRVPRGGAGAP